MKMLLGQVTLAHPRVLPLLGLLHHRAHGEIAQHLHVGPGQKATTLETVYIKTQPLYPARWSLCLFFDSHSFSLLFSVLHLILHVQSPLSLT